MSVYCSWSIKFSSTFLEVCLLFPVNSPISTDANCRVGLVLTRFGQFKQEDPLVGPQTVHWTNSKRRILWWVHKCLQAPMHRPHVLTGTRFEKWMLQIRWRSSYGNLPVKQNNARRGVRLDTLCPMCHKFDEDMGNSFFKGYCAAAGFGWGEGRLLSLCSIRDILEKISTKWTQQGTKKERPRSC